MITDSVLTVLLALPNALLDSFESVNISIPDGVFRGLENIFGFLGFFPIKQLLPIFACMIGLRFARIAWAVVIRIKSFIPTMGD